MSDSGSGESPAISAFQIMERLRIEAQKLGRPEQRLATLDRLQEACDDLSSGKAAHYVQDAAKIAPPFKTIYETYYKRGAVTIRPPRIEEYVKARRTLDQRMLGGSVWTGPTSVTIRGDVEGLLAYVRRREAEQEGLAKRGKRTPYLEDCIDQIRDDAARQHLRFALDDSREAKRQLYLLKQGLLKIPGIDVYAILGQRPELLALPGPPESASSHSGITEEETEAIRKLVARLTSSATLANYDLEYDGQRVKNRATKAALIEKSELAILKRLGGGAD